MAAERDPTSYAVMWANTSNLGDDIQTLAAIHYLKKNGIHTYSFVNREALSTYSGPPVTLIMNGWFIHNLSSFPPSKHITPIFISFHCANETLVAKNVSYFKKYEPIGCRDLATVDMCRRHGIQAEFTGCLTLGFDKVVDKTDEIYVVDINTCRYIPHVNLDIQSFHPKEHILHDITDSSIINNIHRRLELASAVLNKYRAARLVVTTRLHCALPCRAFGTNVLFIHARFNSDKRFKGLEHILSGSESVTEARETIPYEDVVAIQKKFPFIPSPVSD